MYRYSAATIQNGRGGGFARLEVGRLSERCFHFQTFMGWEETKSLNLCRGLSSSHRTRRRDGRHTGRRDGNREGREGGWAEVFAACAKLMTPPPETAAIFFAKSPKGERDAEGDKAPPLSLPPFLPSPSLSRPSLLKVTSPQKRQAPSRRRRKQVKERNLDGLSG